MSPQLLIRELKVPTPMSRDPDEPFASSEDNLNANPRSAPTPNLPALEVISPRLPSGPRPVEDSPDQPKSHSSESSSLAESVALTPMQQVNASLRLGRYEIERELGSGGFGIVYLAYDELLKRRVAIKIPHPRRGLTAEDMERCSVEARIVAKLDHAHIVPVYDIGRTAEDLPYIVSKYIEGCSLSEWLKRTRMSVRESVQLVIRIAGALDHAHKNGLIHRDVKPGNIMLEYSSKPYLVDFGLALSSEDNREHSGFSGTPQYMSPEQSSGEGHLVDGRSDIYSLGVVLYELLTGKPPHMGVGFGRLMSSGPRVPPKAPREIDPLLSRELERITLKCMSLRAADRYQSARELSEDLGAWLNPKQAESAIGGGESKIIPKGLRSFDSDDSVFYLGMLPGPADREGVPESIRFWKSRVEGTDPEKSFRVGVLYGPSGSGKSSFVRAGLLPRLADHVRVAFAESTPRDTENRLLIALKRACPDVPGNVLLAGAIAHLRRGGMPRRKVLVIIDQFEQWLHGVKDPETSELVRALRQCDGENVQCLLLVRDDFWMALTRFMRLVEVQLEEGRNFATIDLFDEVHARKILCGFGRAYGRLPAEGPPTALQDAFLDEAVQGLKREEKIVPVRLSLFAEMMKSRPWVPASLAEAGGTEGIGVSFLEGTFASRTAPPEHRRHEMAARGVLRALLPPARVEIKGHMRGLEELRSASGYAGKPREFDELMRILDGQLRLITPTAPEAEVPGETTPNTPLKHYQLTHDYLVPSLRNWLTRKQKETPSGRAELLLEERSAVWNARPENRQLPTFAEFCRIVRRTRREQWKPAERKMMASAARRQLMNLAFTLSFLAVILFARLKINESLLDRQDRLHAESLVRTLLSSETSRVPQLLGEIRESPRAMAMLPGVIERAEADIREKIHASLALLATDESQVDFLLPRMLEAAPAEFFTIRNELSSRGDRLRETLWNEFDSPNASPSNRFRAACALAAYAPEDERWEKIASDVAARLLLQEPFAIGDWTRSLESAKKWLMPPLEEMIVDEQRSPADRSLALRAFQNLAGDQSGAYDDFEKLFSWTTESDRKDSKRLMVTKRQANAGVALLLAGRIGPVRSVLKNDSDPLLRTHIIDRLAPANLPHTVLSEYLHATNLPSERATLLLALAEYGIERLPVSDRENLAPRLLELLRNDPDAGVHGAVTLLLVRWGMEEMVRQIEEGLKSLNPLGNRRWYVNQQGQTMAVVPGSWQKRKPVDEKEAVSSPPPRSFAIATREVTVEQFLRFRPKHQYLSRFAPTVDCPVIQVTWQDAAEYCNWLSREVGIPREQWCYFPMPGWKGNTRMIEAPGYQNRTGYRLPTEVEWETACRAGTESNFCMGDDPALLPKYAWFNVSVPGFESQPVGRLRPNNLGLFDMHGNVWEWCGGRGNPSGQLVAKLPPRTPLKTPVLESRRGQQRNKHRLSTRPNDDRSMKSG